MANLLTTTELSSFENAIQDHFDTFSSLHSMVVIKEPLKQIVNENTNPYAGYDSSSSLNNFIFIPISGVFPCMVFSSSKDISNALMTQIPMEFQKADKIVKVKEDAKNYLENGQVEQIILDNNEVFTLQSKGFAKNYGNVNYYYFAIKKTP